MVARIIILLFVLTTSLSFKNQSPVNKGNLKVIVNKMSSDKGQIGFCLFNSSEGFPHPEKAIQCVFVKTNINSTEYTFTNIEMGTYAVSVFHDENNNKKLDTNWIGLPSEGVGVSNNGKDDWGPPKYKNAKFVFNKPEQTITISLSYL